MAKKTPQKYSAAFKAQVPLATLQNQLTVVEIIEKLGVSKSMVYKWKDEFRLAKNRLVAIGNVSQVAYDLGFEYPQHFSRMFKKYTGITPKKYIEGIE